MLALRCLKSLDRPVLGAVCKRARLISSSSTPLQEAGIPWFVDPSPITRSYDNRPLPPHIPATQRNAPSIPSDAPDVLKQLHVKLLESPHLDTSHLVVSPAVLPAPGPPLPLRAPHGRRNRGGTYPGESQYDETGVGVWSWVIMAQVKEGTENRGAIESVVRLIRKTLLKMEPVVPLAPKRRTDGSEWVLIDAGNFAIHVVSKGAREKYFNQVDW